MEAAAVAALNNPKTLGLPPTRPERSRYMVRQPSRGPCGTGWSSGTKQWRGTRQGIERSPHYGNDPNSEERRFGNALVNAIATGHAWFLDEPRPEAFGCARSGRLDPQGVVNRTVRRGQSRGRRRSSHLWPSYRVSQGSLQYSLPTLEELKSQARAIPRRDEVSAGVLNRSIPPTRSPPMSDKRCTRTWRVSSFHATCTSKSTPTRLAEIDHLSRPEHFR